MEIALSRFPGSFSCILRGSLAYTAAIGAASVILSIELVAIGLVYGESEFVSFSKILVFLAIAFILSLIFSVIFALPGSIIAFLLGRFVIFRGWGIFAFAGGLNGALAVLLLYTLVEPDECYRSASKCHPEFNASLLGVVLAGILAALVFRRVMIGYRS